MFQGKKMKLSSNLSELKERLHNCNLCPKMVESRLEVLGEDNNHPTTFKGNPHPVFMLIGQCPGRKLCSMKKEKLNITGEPFQFGSGDILNRVLIDAGFNDDEIYITNVMKCNCPEDNKINDEDTRLCLTLWLENEIRITSPKSIIIMGKIAQDWFSKYVNEDIINNIKIFRINHPASLLYNPNNEDEYIRILTDIKKKCVEDEV